MLPHRVRQVQLALLLAERGARFVIVGSTARHLHGAARLPKDLDLVVARIDAPVLEGALRRLASGGQLRPDGASPQGVLTSWSPVDVFLEDDLPAWHPVEVDGTELRVADE